MTLNGKTYYPGQGNNSYIFPGIALATICAGMRVIPEETFLVAANTLAEIVTDGDLERGNLYPPLQDIQACSLKIAVDIMSYAYRECKSSRRLGYYRVLLVLWSFCYNCFVFLLIAIATVHPKPEDYEAFIKAQLYDTNYKTAIPATYQWPKL